MRRANTGIRIGLPLVMILGAVGGVYAHVVPVPRAVAARLPAYTLAPPTPDPLPYAAPTAVTITMPPVESNLGSRGHFVQVVVSFAVAPSALVQAGAQPPSATGSGTAGTSNAALNNRIEALITTVARSSHFTALQTPAGVNQFRHALDRGLVQIFGPNQVGNVLFPTLLTQ